MLEHGFAYYEKIPVSYCKIEIVNENKNWIEIMGQNEKIPFAIDKGELVRVFIIPSEDKTQIMIMAHHLAGDGKSIIYFVKDIMNALSAIPLTYKQTSYFAWKKFAAKRVVCNSKIICPLL